MLSTPNQPSSEQSRWKPPAEAVYKLNTDVAKIDDLNWGIGALIISETMMNSYLWLPQKFFAVEMTSG